MSITEISGTPAPAMSYRDVLRKRVKAEGNSTAAPTQNTEVIQLESSLHALMKQHPNGVPLFRVRQACPLLVHPKVLKAYSSTRQLLASLTNVVRLEGIGVQVLVLPSLRASDPVS